MKPVGVILALDNKGMMLANAAKQNNSAGLEQQAKSAPANAEQAERAEPVMTSTKNDKMQRTHAKHEGTCNTSKTNEFRTPTNYANFSFYYMQPAAQSAHLCQRRNCIPYMPLGAWSGRYLCQDPRP